VTTPDVPLPDMKPVLRTLRRRDRFSIDEGTVERILVGSMGRDDVPAPYRGVTIALDRLRRAPLPAGLAGDPSAVAAMVASMAGVTIGGSRPRRPTVRSPRRIAVAASAAVVGSLSLFTGLAASNALPGAAQSVASHMLSHLGVDVHDPNGHSQGHPDSRGTSTDRPETPPTSRAPAASGKGSDISELSHTTTATGVDKGAEISTEASGGQSRAGQHGAAGSAPNPAPKATPHVSTPNGGGAATGNQASDGRGSQGTSNADAHSSAGSENASSHKP